VEFSAVKFSKAMILSKKVFLSNMTTMKVMHILKISVDETKTELKIRMRRKQN